MLMLLVGLLIFSSKKTLWFYTVKTHPTTWSDLEICKQPGYILPVTTIFAQRYSILLHSTNALMFDPIGAFWIYAGKFFPAQWDANNGCKRGNPAVKSPQYSSRVEVQLLPLFSLYVDINMAKRQNWVQRNSDEITTTSYKRKKILSRWRTAI